MAIGVKALHISFVAHFLAIVGAIMVLIWCISFRGGLAWEATNKNLIFNVRIPLFTSSAPFFLFLILCLCCFRFRLCFYANLFTSVVRDEDWNWSDFGSYSANGWILKLFITGTLNCCSLHQL